jgi:hypothetical protein
MKELRKSVKKLVVVLFKNGNLINQITTAQRLNDYSEGQPKGVRLGYMGHLTYIADETCKLFEKCGSELDDELHEYIVSEEWQEYVTHSLRHTLEKDRHPLGGMKPEPAHGEIKMGDGIDPEFSKPIPVEIKNEAQDKDIDDLNDLSVAADTSYNDQFARFLCQQLVKDLPDRFLGDDSSDEEQDRWIGYRFKLKVVILMKMLSSLTLVKLYLMMIYTIILIHVKGMKRL